MRIVCPNCETSYQLADGTLGATGRKVRCARCGTVWHASPAESMVPAEASDDEWKEAIAGEDTTTGSGAEARETVAAAEPTGEAPAGEEDGTDDAVAPEADSAARPDADLDATPDPDRARGAGALAVAQPSGEGSPSGDGATAPWPVVDAAPAGFSSDAPLRKAAGNRRKRQAGMLSRLFDQKAALPVIVLFVLIGVAAFGVVGRQVVVRTFPNLAGLYDLVGLHVNLRGMDFTDVTTHREMDGSTPVLVVEGTIVNLEDRQKQLPDLRVTLKAANGREVYAWTYAMPQGSVDGQGTVRFKTRLLAPPEAATMAEVRFTDKR